MTTEIRHDEERTRYELVVDGAMIGYSEYVDEGGSLVFPHTVIDPGQRGNGNGEILVRGALDDVRDRGRTIVPTCWFVREFVDLHPEYADLVAG